MGRRFESFRAHHIFNDLRVMATGSVPHLFPQLSRKRPCAAVQKRLLLLLWYAQTDAAQQALSAFASDARKPSVSQSYAQELVHRKDQIGLVQRGEALLVSEASLRQKWRERLKAVNDEALIALDDYTAMLIAKSR